VGDIFFKECATLAVLKLFFADAVGSDMEVPNFLSNPNEASALSFDPVINPLPYAVGSSFLGR